MVAGIIICASIFVQSSEINMHVPSATDVLAVSIVSRVYTLFHSLAFADLSLEFQRSGLQTMVNVSKVAVIVLLLTMVAFWGAPMHPPVAAVAPPAAPYREFVLAVAAALFSYGGWHMVTYTAGETRDPGRTIPRALLIGSLTVTACYVALNAAYLRLLPLDRVVGSTRVAADAAHVLAGDRGASLISALVILSATGVLNGVILAGPRTYYAMASEGLAFGWLGELHPRFQTPHRALVLQAVWSCALVATGTYRALFTRVIYTEWIFFALMSVGLMRLRGRVAFVPAVFGAAAMVVAVIQIAADVQQAASGLLLVAVGLPVYWLQLRVSRVRTKQGE